MGNKIQKAKTTVISVAARSRIKFQCEYSFYKYLSKLNQNHSYISTFNLSIIPFCICIS